MDTILHHIHPYTPNLKLVKDLGRQRERSGLETMDEGGGDMVNNRAVRVSLLSKFRRS